MVSSNLEPWTDPATHREHFVTTANGLRLQYLEWGGVGPPLILIHGGMDNPHAFDDLAPGLTDRHRVIAYARRGHGRSEGRGPFDTETLTDDLRHFMDALGLKCADLAGWSMGGNEVTGLATRYPERVRRIVYLDGAFDCADPDFLTAFNAIPPEFLTTPSSAMASLGAYRDYQQAEVFAPLEDMSRIEAYLRESVLIHEDGSVEPRMPIPVQEALFADLLADPPRQYTKISCPAFAIFPESQFNLQGADVRRRELALACEKRYMAPLREKFRAQLQRELTGVKVISVPGAHSDFFLNSREQVLHAMGEFLSETG